MPPLDFKKALHKLLKLQRKLGATRLCQINAGFMHALFPNETELRGGVITRASGIGTEHVWLVRGGRVVECSHEYVGDPVVYTELKDAPWLDQADRDRVIALLEDARTDPPGDFENYKSLVTLRVTELRVGVFDENTGKVRSGVTIETVGGGVLYTGLNRR